MYMLAIVGCGSTTFEFYIADVSQTVNTRSAQEEKWYLRRNVEGYLVLF